MTRESGRACSRAEIVDAAVRVFAERGYAATSLEAIARLVGLTRPGLLHHFPSKEALFAAVIADQEEWAREQFGRPAEPEPGEVLASLRALVPTAGDAGTQRVRLQMVQCLQGEAMSGHPAAVAFATNRLLHVRQHIRHRLDQAQAAGELREGLDLDALTLLASYAVNGLQAQWLLDEDLASSKAFEQLLALIALSTTD